MLYSKGILSESMYIFIQKVSLSLFCRHMTSLTQIAIGLITLHISII